MLIFIGIIFRKECLARAPLSPAYGGLIMDVVNTGIICNKSGVGWGGGVNLWPRECTSEENSPPLFETLQKNTA